MMTDPEMTPKSTRMNVENPTSSDVLLLRSSDIEVVRRSLAAGTTLAAPSAPHDSTVFCLSGRIHVHREERSRVLTAGSLAHLRQGEAYRLIANEDSSLLITVHQRLPENREASAN